MTRIRFQRSLDDLKENLLVMAGLAEQAIQRAIEAYRVRDLSICDLVSRSEIAINRLERDIDQAALDLLAMEQPMAIDLRFILSVIKINADLERVGDAAKASATGCAAWSRWRRPICRWTFRAWHRWPPTWCARACRRSLKPTRTMARTVLTMDDAVDAMNRAAYNR
jgi:phosphate transport system protein